MTCSLNNEYSIFGYSNSYGAAKLTGKIAQILSQYPNINYNKLENILMKISSRNQWNNFDFDCRKRLLCDNKKITNLINLIKIANIVKEVLNINKDDNKIYSNYLYSDSIGLRDIYCTQVLEKIEREFNIKIEYCNVSKFEFLSIYTLTRFIEKIIN